MRGQQPVAFLRAQHVGMALERGEAVRDVVVHGGEQRQLAGIARQGCVQVGEHRDAVGDLGRPVRIGRRPLRECHRQPVALVRSGRQLTAVGDHRGADGLEMVGHRDLPGEPGGDIGPHHRGPARDPGHHRRRGQVHLHREPVVQHHRLLDAEPVLTSDGHGRRHRPARTVRPAARPFVGALAHPRARGVRTTRSRRAGRRTSRSMGSGTTSISVASIHGRVVGTAAGHATHRSAAPESARSIFVPCASSTARYPSRTSPTTTCSSSPAVRRWPRGSTSTSAAPIRPARPCPWSPRT